MRIEITQVASGRDRADFIRFPYRLHKGRAGWVAPLISEVKTVLDPRKNPFFEHAEAALFLARRDGRVVGRIAGIIDRNFIAVKNEPIGLFGFFDAIDDGDVARELFGVAAKWLKERGMTRMLGPANPSMNDELGILIDAFEIPPAVKMIWNPDYYKALCEGAGLTKAMDIFAWELRTANISPRLARVGEAILKRTPVKFRHPDMKHFDKEVKVFREIYNQAWADNWGFVPWTEAEFDHVAKSLKQVIDPKLVLVAELDGKTVGFVLTLPDLNVALKHINGRLFPFGLPILLWHARKIRQVRVVILGIVKEYRNRGIDAAMYFETYRLCAELGYEGGEASWILENNEPMNRMMEMMGGKRFKTYRLYERSL